MKITGISERKLFFLVFITAIAVFPMYVKAVNADAGMVHDYGRCGDDPATKDVDESLIVASNDTVENKRYHESDKFQMTANDTSISIYKYKKGADGSNYYNFDIARFSAQDEMPQLKIQLVDGTVIDSVEIYPERYYPRNSYSISSDNKTLTFTMSDNLPYCIVNINGTLTDMKLSGLPMLAIIKDLPEIDKPDLHAGNVLNFKDFSAKFLNNNPVRDKKGDVCRQAGEVTDTSLNTSEVFTWSYDAGHFVDPLNKNVQFPDKRVRSKNDVSEAFQAALELVKSSKELDTVYFPAGTYIWSGLCIKNWDGNGKDGKLNIYLDEDSLLVNRVQECKQAIEPAIGIWYSSNITISGRGIIDGNACYTLTLDRKDARDTPHQGGSMLVHCSNITFNDTYVRDVKQWNWECHTVKNVTYNNIKGLSPFCHSWVDGLDLTSGKNVTVNSAITLGNDDTFASGHYNPSDEFPRRFLEELERAKGNDRIKMEADKSRVCAAAAIYNRDRLIWDNDDSENITVNNVLGWSAFANNIRLGANTYWKGEPGNYSSYKLKSYTFDNFNSVMRDSSAAIRVHNGKHKSYQEYESIVFRNCSFAGNRNENAVFPDGSDLYKFTPENVVIDNCWFSNPSKIFAFKNIINLTLNNIYNGGILVTDMSHIQLEAVNVKNISFTANGKTILANQN